MKILIADDHQLLADALAELVKENEADSEILRAGSLDDAMDKMDRDGAVEIVLVDYDLPGMGGVEGLERLHSRHPLIPCAIYSGSEDIGLASSALAGGAAGFIPKSMSAPGFFHAIKLIQVGEKFIPAELYENVASLAAFNRVDPESASDFVIRSGLSPREVDVIRALVKGISNRQIGRELGVKEVTVKLHLRRVYKKIGVSNRTQAVKLAMANGIG